MRNKKCWGNEIPHCGERRFSRRIFKLIDAPPKGSSKIIPQLSFISEREIKNVEETKSRIAGKGASCAGIFWIDWCPSTGISEANPTACFHKGFKIKNVEEAKSRIAGKGASCAGIFWIDWCPPLRNHPQLNWVNEYLWRLTDLRNQPIFRKTKAKEIRVSFKKQIILKYVSFCSKIPRPVFGRARNEHFGFWAGAGERMPDRSLSLSKRTVRHSPAHPEHYLQSVIPMKRRRNLLG